MDVKLPMFTTKRTSSITPFLIDDKTKKNEQTEKK